jgi:hypothetical protein
MNFNTQLEGINNEDVIAFGHSSLKASELRYTFDLAFLRRLSETLMEQLQTHPLQIDLGQDGGKVPGTAYDSQAWLCEGVLCQVRPANQGDWQTGRMKLQISLEFCPDRPESDLRSPIAQETANLSPVAISPDSSTEQTQLNLTINSTVNSAVVSPAKRVQKAMDLV